MNFKYIKVPSRIKSEWPVQDQQRLGWVSLWWVNTENEVIPQGLAFCIWKAKIYCCSIMIRFGKARNKSLAYVWDARVPSLSPPWSGYEYFPLDFLWGEYKGSLGYMRLSHWVNTVPCDKGFREKGILAELKGKGEKNAVCISVLSCSEMENKAPVGRCRIHLPEILFLLRQRSTVTV